MAVQMFSTGETSSETNEQYCAVVQGNSCSPARLFSTLTPPMTSTLIICISTFEHAQYGQRHLDPPVTF